MAIPFPAEMCWNWPEQIESGNFRGSPNSLGGSRGDGISPATAKILASHIECSLHGGNLATETLFTNALGILESPPLMGSALFISTSLLIYF